MFSRMKNWLVAVSVVGLHLALCGELISLQAIDVDY